VSGTERTCSNQAAKLSLFQSDSRAAEIWTAGSKAPVDAFPPTSELARSESTDGCISFLPSARAMPRDPRFGTLAEEAGLDRCWRGSGGGRMPRRG
jgi:hypothetical protein